MMTQGRDKSYSFSVQLLQKREHDRTLLYRSLFLKPIENVRVNSKVNVTGIMQSYSRNNVM